MAEKLKFKDALLQAAKNSAAKDQKDREAASVVEAIESGGVKPAVLEGLADGVVRFLPKFRKNTNVASVDWSQYIPLLELAIGLIAKRLGL